MTMAPIPDIVADIKAGKFVIIVDDDDRENEGDLFIAAEKISPEAINFMAKNARGLICVSLMGERLDALNIPLMVQDNSSKHCTAFTVSVEARHRVSTGISAADRAETVRTLIDPRTRPEDLLKPGHTFPLRAREGGVLVRAGHTEASVDLSRMAGLYPAGVICEIMDDDGTMARLPNWKNWLRSGVLKSAASPISSPTAVAMRNSFAASPKPGCPPATVSSPPSVTRAP